MKEYAINVPWVFTCTTFAALILEALTPVSLFSTEQQAALIGLCAASCVAGLALECYFIDMGWRKRE